MHLAIIDLDGTIIRTGDDKGALEGLRIFASAGWQLAVATNQPLRVRAKRNDLDAARAAIDAAARRTVPWYICSHDNDDRCECRKPMPGLLQRAISDCGASAIATWMIGDKWSDMLAAQRAATHCCLVGWFGYRQDGNTMMQPTKPPEVYCRDLLTVAELLTGVYA